MKRYNSLEEFIAATIIAIFEYHNIDKNTSLEMAVDYQYSFGRYYLRVERVFTFQNTNLSNLWINNPDDSFYREYLPCSRKPLEEDLKKQINLFYSQLETIRLICKNLKVMFKSNITDNNYKTEKELLKLAN